MKASALERTQRLDAEFFRKAHVAAAEAIARKRHDTVVDVAVVSDGNHFTISTDFVEQGVPYYRGQDVAGHFFIEQAIPNLISQEAFDRTYMLRSHLRKGDVLLSIVGTIGELSLVASKAEATCSCKLAILRPKSISPEYLAVALRSIYGRLQIERLTRGAVQLGLILEDMSQLLVPRFAPAFEAEISGIVMSAKNSQGRAFELLGRAEDSLSQSLGLLDWLLPQALTYSASALSAFGAGRLDAEYFAPRIRNLIRHLGGDGSTLGDIALSRRSRFIPGETGDFDYIEISDLDGDGAASSTCLPKADAPSRAKWLVQPGDVITSTVRPIRRLSALIAEGQGNAVCSSGFVVLQSQRVRPEVLLTYLRLPLVCELMNLHTSASMYPAISETDLLGLPFKAPDEKAEQVICGAVAEARTARKHSAKLLVIAKRAVEIAIEKDEAAALRFLAEKES